MGIATRYFSKWAKGNARKSEEEAQVAGQDRKTRIVARVKGFVWRRAAALQEAELPQLAGAIARGTIKADQVKDRLRGLGTELLNEAVTYFDRQDIDILAEFGEEQVMSWIRSAVDEISIFKKWPTAQVLVEGGAEAILAVGLDKAGDYYDKVRQRVVDGEDGAKEGTIARRVEDQVKASIPKVG